MTDKTYHIGHTNVDYKIKNNETSNSVTFTLFSGDVFWDPNILHEKIFGGTLGIRTFQADGMGPNLKTM